MERQHRREAEAKLSKAMEERLYTIRLDLAKEKKVREDTQEHNYSQVGESIRALQEEIDQQIVQSEENSQRVIQQLSEEVASFHEQMLEERRQRETAQSQMVRMLEDAHARVVSEL